MCARTMNNTWGFVTIYIYLFVNISFILIIVYYINDLGVKRAFMYHVSSIFHHNILHRMCYYAITRKN